MPKDVKKKSQASLQGESAAAAAVNAAADMPPAQQAQAAHRERTLTRVLFFLGGSALVLYLLFSASAPRPRSHNAISSLSRPLSHDTALHHRTVAVADLHGDYSHALNVLNMAGVIDHDGGDDVLNDPPKWSGSRATLVSTGDIVDRGDDTIRLYTLFKTLRSQAARAGGRVLNCLGNHEMMNAMGDWRYVTRGDIDTFGGVEERKLAISTSGWIGQEWLAHYAVSHVIQLFPQHEIDELKQRSENPLPTDYTSPSANFVHGGIHPDWANQGMQDITTTGYSLLNHSLTHQADPHAPLARGHFPPGTTPHQAAIWYEDGPFWYRGYATEPEESTACALASKSAQLLQVDWLVMGHTPHFDGFVHRCDPPLIHLIDTGISRAYGGEQSALVFDSDLKWEGKQWVEEVRLIALYRGRRPRTVHTRRRVVE